MYNTKKVMFRRRDISPMAAIDGFWIMKVPLAWSKAIPTLIFYRQQ
jgi:hypothetical protein